MLTVCSSTACVENKLFTSKLGIQLLVRYKLGAKKKKVIDANCFRDWLQSFCYVHSRTSCASDRG